MPPSESIRLSEFVSNAELPCTVMVTRGYSQGNADEEESISNGEVITLHSIQDLQVIRAKDHVDRDTTLPVVHCDNKFEILPKNPRLDNTIYETFLEMITDPNMPEKVRVTAAVDTGDDDTIYEDDILEMVTVSGNSQSGTGDNRCIVLKNQFGDNVKLPLSTPGKFTPRVDTVRYSMLEVLDKIKLPVRVLLKNANAAQAKSTGLNKFTLLRREVETSVLATVNRELIYLPLDCEVEVCHLAAPCLNGAPPPEIAVSVVADADTDAPADATTAAAADVPPSSASPPDGWSTAGSSARSSDVFEDSFGGGSLGALSATPLLSESDRERIRVGSVRRFGSQSNLKYDATSDMAAMAEEEEEVIVKPQRALELLEQLQEKAAEAVRLQEWCNKWQAKCQRLEAQTQHMRRGMDDTERRAMFWRHRAQVGGGAGGSVLVTDAVLEDLEQYQKTGDKKHLGSVDDDDEFPPFSPLGTMPNANAAIAQQEQKQESMDASSLSISDMQSLLAALNMSQYGQLFLDEQIDGGLLLDLPEDSLKSDLGMESLLHRKKLLRSLRGLGPAPLRELISR